MNYKHIVKNEYLEFITPYGKRPLINADTTASGLICKAIEKTMNDININNL